MDASEQILSSMAQVARSYGVAVIEDPYHLLTPEETVEGLQVIPYRGALSFRRAWEPVRQASPRPPVLIHATVESPFYPDVLALCTHSEQRRHVTPQTLLQGATSDSSWPEAINALGRAIAENVDGIVRMHRLFRRVKRAGMSDEDARALVLSSIIGVDLFGSSDRVGLWRFYTEKPGLAARLGSIHSSFPGMLSELAKQMGGPFVWLADGQTDTAVQALWMLAILSQHMADPRELLALLDTAFFDVQSWSLEEVTELARSLRSSSLDLAKQQIAVAERALPQEAWQKIGGKLQLQQPLHALKVCLKEETSPALLETALRYLVSEATQLPALANDADLEKLLVRVADPSTAVFSLVQGCADLEQATTLLRYQRDLLRLQHGIGPAVSSAIAGAESEKSPAPLVRAYLNTGLYGVELMAALAKRAAERLDRSSLLPLATAQQLEHRTQQRTEELGRAAKAGLDQLNATFCQLAAGEYPRWISDKPGVHFVSDFVSQVLVPRWQQHGKKPVWILLFDGMRWDAWEQYVRPALEERLELVEGDTPVEPLLAILPSSTAHSRRALFSGRLPDGFAPNEAEDKLLAKACPGGPKAFTVDKPADKDEQAQINLVMNAEGVRVIVFGFCDKVLHSFGDSLGALYEENIRPKALHELKKALKEIPEDALVFVVTDHGFIELSNSWADVPVSAAAEKGDITYRYGILETSISPEARTAVFEAKDLRLPGQVATWSDGMQQTKQQKAVVLATQHHVLKRKGGGGGGPTPRYSHGGISLQEMVIPCAALTVRKPVTGPVVKWVACELSEEKVIEGATVEVRGKLQLAGALLLDVDVHLGGPSAETQRVDLQPHQPTELVFQVTAPAVPAGQESLKVDIPLQVKPRGKAKGKMPPARTLHLTVMPDPGKVARETSSTLDTMFGKKKR